MDSTLPCAQDDGMSDIRPSARDDSCPSRALLLRRSSMSCAYCRLSVVVAGFCVAGVGRSTSHHHRLVAGCEAVVPHVPAVPSSPLRRRPLARCPSPAVPDSSRSSPSPVEARLMDGLVKALHEARLMDGLVKALHEARLMNGLVKALHEARLMDGLVKALHEARLMDGLVKALYTKHG